VGGGTVRVYPAEVIMKQGERADCMFFVLSGEIDVYISEERVSSIGFGATIGELALINNGEKAAWLCSTDKRARSK
jgi:voltage-gated potassium channel